MNSNDDRCDDPSRLDLSVASPTTVDSGARPSTTTNSTNNRTHVIQTGNSTVSATTPRRRSSLASTTTTPATATCKRRGLTRVQSPSFHVMVTGHVESATFPSSKNDNLYCRYVISHGLDWIIVHGVDTGLSQIARRRWNGCDNRNDIIWNFPIDIGFRSTNAYGWPRIAVAVYGLDRFGRDMVRGYGSVLIPTIPGRYEKYVPTYAPVSGSFCQRLMNWIAGTMPEYYDTKFITQNDGRAVTRVRSEGVVKIVLNVVTKDMEKFGYTFQGKGVNR